MIPDSWSIVIPLYQGGNAALEFFNEIPIESRTRICIVNDGSTDGIPQKLEQLGYRVLHSFPNQGKSRALELGFEQARHWGKSWALTMDADGQHAWQDVQNFIAHWNPNRYDLYLGRRNFKQEMPFARVLSNSITSFLMSLICGTRIRDSQCGFRLYSLAALAQIEVKSKGFQWESEVLFALLAKGFRLSHVPVKTLYGDEVSTIHPWRDTFKFVRVYWALCQKKMGL